MADFGISASIVAADTIPPGKHDRSVGHFGTQDDTTITVGDITLAAYLANLYSSVAALQAIPANTQRFGINAYIQPYFGLSAFIVGPETTGSYGLDAHIVERAAATFGLSANIKAVLAYRIGLLAYIGEGSRGPNVVRAPEGGSSATYAAISNWSSTLPAHAADGLHNGREGGFIPDHGWDAAAAGVGRWWQVTWSVPQTIDMVVLYDCDDGGHYFGSDGHLEFSDGSQVAFTGLPNASVSQFGDSDLSGFIITFPRRTTSSLRVVSDVTGISQAGLQEVEAYDSERYL